MTNVTFAISNSTEIFVCVSRWNWYSWKGIVHYPTYYEVQQIR